MMKRLSCTLTAAACALLMLACGESTTTNTGNTNTNTNTNANRSSATTTTTTTTPNSNAATATTTSGSGEKIGVAECDEFIEKYDACIASKVPEAARAQYRSSIEQWRSSWRTLAANPQTRGTLAAACKTTIEQARTSMKSYGCDF